MFYLIFHEPNTLLHYFITTKKFCEKDFRLFNVFLIEFENTKKKYYLSLFEYVYQL